MRWIRGCDVFVQEKKSFQDLLFINTPDLTGMHMRRALLLHHFDFHIECRPGPTNVADWPSRYPRDGSEHNAGSRKHHTSIIVPANIPSRHMTTGSAHSTDDVATALQEAMQAHHSSVMVSSSGGVCETEAESERSETGDSTVRVFMGECAFDI